MRAIRTGVAFSALLLLAAAPLSAQTARIGVKGGIPFSTFYGDASADAESVTRFAVGAFATLPVSSNFSIQPELLYAGRGAQGSDDDVDVELRLTYLQLPVLARYSFGTAQARPTIFAGPSLALRTSCDAEVSTGGVSLGVDCDDEEIEADLKRFDLGAVFGAGVDFDLGRVTMNVDGRFDLGLTSIDGSTEKNDLKNRAYSVLVGFSVPVGR